MLDVIATFLNAQSPLWSEHRPLEMEPYCVNLSAAIGMMQVEPKFVIIKGQFEVFKTPLIRVDYAGNEDYSCLYISGVVQEILARTR